MLSCGGFNGLWGPPQVERRVRCLFRDRSRVTRILVMETLPLADVKARLSELVAQVEKQHDQITVTRNGRPAVVVVSIEEWESLQETLEILADPAAVTALAHAREEAEHGELHTTEDVLAVLAERHGRRSA